MKKRFVMLQSGSIPIDQKPYPPYPKTLCISPINQEVVSELQKLLDNESALEIAYEDGRIDKARILSIGSEHTWKKSSSLNIYLQVIKNCNSNVA